MITTSIQDQMAIQLDAESVEKTLSIVELIKSGGSKYFCRGLNRSDMRSVKMLQALKVDISLAVNRFVMFVFICISVCVF